MPRRLSSLLVAVLLLSAVAACGSEDRPEEAAAGPLAGVSTRGDVGTSLEVAYDGEVEATAPVSEVISEGEGNTVEVDTTVLLHLYIGNGTTGEESINTYDDGKAVSVRMSEDQLFKPVLDAVVGLPSGSRVVVAAAAQDIWGKAGEPRLKIKGSDTAVFVADIVSVQPVEVLDGPQGEKADVPRATPDVLERGGDVVGLDWSDAPRKAPRDLQVITLVEGDGPEVGAQEMVTFDYFGAVWGEKKPFDESYSRAPSPFAVGVGQLIPAWDEAIPGLTRGSRVLIIAPPDKAYGEQDQPNIPGGSTLVFVVDVLGVDA